MITFHVAYSWWYRDGYAGTGRVVMTQISKDVTQEMLSRWEDSIKAKEGQRFKAAGIQIVILSWQELFA